MAKVLRTTRGGFGSFRDGRTVRALSVRGLIKKVGWEPEYYRVGNTKGSYTFRLTVKGRSVARVLRLLPIHTIQEVFQR